jgi:hypothetical protein
VTSEVESDVNGGVDGAETLGWVGTLGAVLVLAWVALVANEIASRRREKRPE